MTIKGKIERVDIYPPGQDPGIYYIGQPLQGGKIQSIAVIDDAIHIAMEKMDLCFKGIPFAVLYYDESRLK